MQTDVVIVGNELAGVAAGALLAHQGVKVAWIGNDLEYNVPLGDFLAPHCLDLWQLGGQQTQQDLFRDLALRQEVRREFHGPTGIGLIGDPQERLWLGPDPQERLKELKRAFGSEAEPIIQKLTHWPQEALSLWLSEGAVLHEQGFWARRKRKKRLKGQDLESGEPTAFVEGMSQLGLKHLLEKMRSFVQWTDNSLWRPVGHVEAARNLVEGIYLSRLNHLSARQQLVKILIQFIKRHGGSVHPGLEIKNIESKGKKLHQLHTNGPLVIGAKAFVDATEGRSFAPLINNAALNDLLKSEEGMLPMTREAAVVRWLLPKDALPRGMPDRALHILDDDGPLESVLVGVYDNLKNTDPQQKNVSNLAERFAVVVAQSPCRKGRGLHTTIELEVFLDRCLPFAKNRVVTHDAFDGKQTPPICPGYDLNEESFPFMGRAIQTSIKNLLRAGRDLAPGLGINGELHTAYAVCQKIAKSAGPKKALFREPPPT